MAGAETKITHICMVAASKIGAVVFKNVRGMFLTPDGSRKVQAGLQIRGSSDLIGWKAIEITPEMVGTKVAVFVAIEVKTATGRIRSEQRIFIENVLKAGGIAGVARCEKDVHLVLDMWHEVH